MPLMATNVSPVLSNLHVPRNGRGLMTYVRLSRSFLRRRDSGIAFLSALLINFSQSQGQSVAEASSCLRKSVGIPSLPRPDSRDISPLYCIVDQANLMSLHTRLQ